MTERKPKGYWTQERIRETASKYTKVTPFKKENYGAYVAACKLGIVKELFPEVSNRRKTKPKKKKIDAHSSKGESNLQKSLLKYQYLF